MDRRISTAFGILVVATGCIRTTTPVLPADAPECVVMDVWSTMDDTGKQIQEMSGALLGERNDRTWLKSVRACKVGQYILWTPADGKSNNFMLFEKDGIGIMMTNGYVTVLDKGPRVAATLDDNDHDGRFDTVRYAIRPEPADGRIEEMDRDADGCADVRFPDPATRKNLFSVKMGGTWHDLVREGTQFGYKLDGTFYPINVAKGVVIEEMLKECSGRAAAAD